MPRRLLKPALFFDFDNTLTSGDVLDRVIEAFSPNEEWRDWEEAWEHGRLSARECLRRQVENLRVRRDELFDYLLQIRVDPAFVEIVEWARARRIEVKIVSDSFAPFIDHILANNGVEGVRVYANDLVFVGDRIFPAFPHADPACMRSANAKARHMQPYRSDHYLVFAGDGHSDLDAALAADLAFAKSTLARELDALRVGYHPFETLDPVLAYLRAEFSRARAARLRIA